MATAKPRITVTLEPATYEVVKELSQLNGESMSSIVAGLVDAAAPVLQRIVEAGHAFKSMSASARSDIGTLLIDAERDLLPQVDAVGAEFLGLLDGAAAIARGEDDPRLVTRGSRPPTPHPTTDETGE